MLNANVALSAVERNKISNIQNHKKAMMKHSRLRTWRDSKMAARGRKQKASLL
jgi:hypothetical protein